MPCNRSVPVISRHNSLIKSARRRVPVIQARALAPVALSGRSISVSAAMAGQLTLVSFDVDGTLIHSIGEKANKLHKDAFAQGFKQVFGLDTHIDVIKHHGSTDPLIVIKVLEHHGIPKDEAMAKLPQVKEAMNAYFLAMAEQEAAEGIEILPGVRELLTAFQNKPIASCLVTGNLEPIGWAKMKALGIYNLFTEPKFGGFGSDFCSGNTEESWRDRGKFVAIAAEKGQKVLPTASTGFKARWHVGDTPMDIKAALDAGAHALGVTTGIFSRQELLDAVPPGTRDDLKVVILDSLKDTQEVLRVLGL